jgi:hypothetical protein
VQLFLELTLDENDNGISDPSERVVVEIDIKPGGDVNSINLKSKGVIPVALLGSDAVDVTLVDPDSLSFGPADATLEPASLAHAKGPHYADVNGDSIMDLVAHFRTQETGIAEGHTEACLRGELDGTPFEACDAVMTKPMCGLGPELALLLPPLWWLRRRRGLVA